MFCFFSSKTKKKKKNRNLDLSIDCLIKLFDNTVLPMLTYGCEIWNFGDISCIEKIHTDFLKQILHVKNPVMIYGELGRYPSSTVITRQCVYETLCPQPDACPLKKVHPKT